MKADLRLMRDLLVGGYEGLKIIAGDFWSSSVDYFEKHPGKATIASVGSVALIGLVIQSNQPDMAKVLEIPGLAFVATSSSVGGISYYGPEAREQRADDIMMQGVDLSGAEFPTD